MTRYRCIFLWMVFSAVVMGGVSIAKTKEVRILNFIMNEIEICDTAFTCHNMNKSELPDPSETVVKVVNFDQDEGMLMFRHNGKDMWVHQSEVDLNETAVASVVCTSVPDTTKTSQDITSTPKSVYTTYGLGEGCK